MMLTSLALFWVTLFNACVVLNGQKKFSTKVSFERLILSPATVQAKIDSIKWQNNRSNISKGVCVSVLRVFKWPVPRIPKSICFRYSEKIPQSSDLIGTTFLLHFKINKRKEKILLGELTLASSSAIKQVEKIMSKCPEKRAERHPSKCGAARIDNSTFKHEVKVKEGNDVVLTCNALGKPPFVWRWQLPFSIFLRLSNKKKLKQIRRGNNGQLVIKSAKKAFQGKYKCTVYNALGKASSYVDLKVDRTNLQCNGNLKIRPGESKYLRSPYFYSYMGQKVSRKCTWKLCPSKGWKLMINMMIVYTTYSSNQFATWRTLDNKQKPSFSIECGKRKKPSCGSINGGTVTSDCRSGCVKIVYRPRYTQKTLGNLRLSVLVGISKELQKKQLDLRSLYCNSDFVVKARIKSFKGKKQKLFVQIIKSYKAADLLSSQKQMYFAINSSIAGHPIFDCMVKHKSVNFLSGRKRRNGTFEVGRVISNKNISAEMIQQLEAYKENSTTCSLSD